MNRQHHELLWNMVSLLYAKGVRHAILCPGSRNGPIINAFACFKAITSHSCVDERSAAYQALGIAEELMQPVVVVCTSGTAALNLAPAIAEAFYQHVPLIVITADRPAEWIDQLDGQAIRQTGIYHNHIKAQYSFSDENSHADTIWHAMRIVNEAVNTAMELPYGPVHINVPLREPLYLPAGEIPVYDAMPKNIIPTNVTTILDQNQISELCVEFDSYDKVLMLGGQGRINSLLKNSLSHLSINQNTAIVGDCLSNLTWIPDLLSISDQAVASFNADHAPELLITFGRSILCRTLKTFLRSNKPKAHWHIGMEPAADVYQSLTRHIRTSPEYCFKVLVAANLKNLSRTSYKNDLLSIISNEHKTYLADNCKPENFTEFSATKRLLELLPENEVLHLGNSMAVRLADRAGVPDKNIEIFCNRGTSGIDGSVSTAVGHALAAPAKHHTLLIGDLGLFYDINGLWRDTVPANLLIVVLNNHGGRIFETIKGPGNIPQALPFFTTPHNRSARAVAEMFGLEYMRAGNSEEMEEIFKRVFVMSARARVVELDFK